VSQRFPKDARIRKRRDFLSVQSSGRKFHTRCFLAIVLPTSGDHGRVGITVSKKVGNAVKRNRIKRLVREYARREHPAPPGTDVVFIAKRNAAKVAGYAAVERDLKTLEGRLSA
jgi:ribonuclease P protein component